MGPPLIVMIMQYYVYACFLKPIVKFVSFKDSIVYVNKQNIFALKIEFVQSE